MNLLGTGYTLGRHALEIYVAGCAGKNGVHCKNCHNPESWSFNQGTDYRECLNSIVKKYNDFKNMIERIEIYGGEPLDNNHEDLKDLLVFLKNNIGIDVIIFTRFAIEEVPDFVKEHCTLIKCGEYLEELKVDDNYQYGYKLATSNQKIYKKGVDF